MRKWLKLYTEILHDPKMLALSDSAFRVCINLFAVAGWVDDDEGRLGDVPALCIHLRTKPSKLQPALDKLQACGILAEKDGVYFAAHWSQRNRVSPSDLPLAIRERVAKSRKYSTKTTNGNTLHTQTSNADVTPQNRIEESREENTIGADAPSAPDPVKELAAVFEQAAKIVLPTPSGKRGKDQVGVTWWHPLREMVKMGNGNSDTLLRDTVRRMRRDGLTIAAPISCLKVFTSLNGERHSGPEESPTPEL